MSIPTAERRQYCCRFVCKESSQFGCVSYCRNNSGFWPRSTKCRFLRRKEDNSLPVCLQIVITNLLDCCVSYCRNSNGFWSMFIKCWFLRHKEDNSPERLTYHRTHHNSILPWSVVILSRLEHPGHSEWILASLRWRWRPLPERLTMQQIDLSL